MRNRFDQLGKKIGLEALGPSGPTVAHDEIAPDAQHADIRHEPDPRREAARARLGLLGRIASVLCLIEIYSGAPDEEETLACLGKLIAFRQKRRRDARKKKTAETVARPFLWIITAGRPKGVLAALAAIRARGWPRGVYWSPGTLFGAGRARLAGLDGTGGLLRVGIVVASELRRERSTILVRLMAAGPVLPGALADLSALPADAHEHAVASQILLGLRHALESSPQRTTEEQEFIVSMQSIWEEARNEGRREGRDEGLREGRNEGEQAHARATLRRVLSLRKLAPSRGEEAQIDGCDDIGRLDRWIERALTAESVDEVLRARVARARRGSASRSR